MSLFLFGQEAATQRFGSMPACAGRPASAPLPAGQQTAAIAPKAQPGVKEVTHPPVHSHCLS